MKSLYYLCAFTLLNISVFASEDVCGLSQLFAFPLLKIAKKLAPVTKKTVHEPGGVVFEVSEGDMKDALNGRDLDDTSNEINVLSPILKKCNKRAAQDLDNLWVVLRDYKYRDSFRDVIKDETDN